MTDDDLLQSRIQTQLADDAAIETIAIRAGHTRSHEGEHSEAIYPTSSFVYRSAAHAAACFSGEEEGNIYSRFTNPTVSMFEKRLAAMEGGSWCVATSSGMAAIMSVCLGLLRQGDEVVASRDIFGTSSVLFKNYMGRFGVDTTFVTLTDLNEWRSAMSAKTKLLFMESPSNPLLQVADIERVADIAHNADAHLVVDNCLCSPSLQQPLKFGADIVTHSATKYLDGQGRAIGGAVVGHSQAAKDEIYGVLRTTGPTMSPFNAWLFHKGLETLSLRMHAHSQNAIKLAEWLNEHPKVKKVHYTGLNDHPQYDLARKQQANFGGLLSFEVNGSQQQAWQVIDRTKMLSITANLGDVKTTITHPATTTHGRLSPEDRQKAGISDALVRVAVGLEHIDDIIKDLEPGLSSI